MDDFLEALVQRVPVGDDRYIKPWWMIVFGFALALAFAFFIVGLYALATVELVAAVWMAYPLTESDLS